MVLERLITIINQYKKQLIICLGLITVGLLLYNVLIFRVSGTSPALSEVPSSSRLMKLTFTQPVRSIEGVEIGGKAITDEDISVDGNTVSIDIPSTSLEKDTLTSVRFSKATSAWFGLTVNDFVRQFTPRYIPFNKLSKEQQAAAVNASNSGQSNDPFLNNSFPIITDDFTIQASKGYTSDVVFVSVTFSKDIPDYDTSNQPAGMTEAEAETLRSAALDTIRKYKGKPENYAISYSNEYLNEKYFAHDEGGSAPNH